MFGSFKNSYVFMNHVFSLTKRQIADVIKAKVDDVSAVIRTRYTLTKTHSIVQSPASK